MYHIGIIHLNVIFSPVHWSHIGIILLRDGAAVFVAMWRVTTFKHTINMFIEREYVFGMYRSFSVALSIALHFDIERLLCCDIQNASIIFRIFSLQFHHQCCLHMCVCVCVIGIAGQTSFRGLIQTNPNMVYYCY